MAVLGCLGRARMALAVLFRSLEVVGPEDSLVPQADCMAAVVLAEQKKLLAD